MHSPYLAIFYLLLSNGCFFVFFLLLVSLDSVPGGMWCITQQDLSLRLCGCIKREVAESNSVNEFYTLRAFLELLPVSAEDGKYWPLNGQLRSSGVLSHRMGEKERKKNQTFVAQTHNRWVETIEVTSWEIHPSILLLPSSNKHTHTQKKGNGERKTNNELSFSHMNSRLCVFHRADVELITKQSSSPGE